MSKTDYSDLKRIPGEEVYVEFDTEFEQWSVFGCESGFCYGQESSEEAAQDIADELLMNKEN